jgi:branched-chain amino acid transport system substrate-binding protein
MTQHIQTLLAGVSTLALALPAFAEDDYFIGVISAQSGYLAPYDQPSLAGFRFCVDEINAAGGINGNMPIRIDVRDTRSDIAETIKAAQELVDAGARFIVSPADGDPTIAVGQLTVPAGIPTITFAGTAPILTLVGDYVFGSYPGDNLQATVTAQYARELGYETAYIVKSPDAAYTMGGPEYFAEVFTREGGTISGESLYSLNQPDFSAIVTTIKAVNPQPDVVMTSAWEPDFPAFIKALRGAGVTSQVIGGDVLDTPTIRGLGSVVDGVIHASGGFAEEGSAHAAFNARFLQATGKEADNNYYVNGCDIAHMIKHSVEIAGTTDPSDVRDALASIENGVGIMSSYTYAGTDRMPIRSVVLARIEDGTKIFIRRGTPNLADVPAP